MMHLTARGFYLALIYLSFGLIFTVLVRGPALDLVAFTWIVAWPLVALWYFFLIAIGIFLLVFLIGLVATILD